MLLITTAAVGSPSRRHSDLVPKEADARPSVSIPLGQLGFVPPATSLLTQRIAGTTLNFVDDQRLLLTFRKAGLMKREADAEPDDDDQLIHAEIVNIATRQIEKAVDWRMHDRGRFLWPAKSGRFLVRQRDALFLAGASLELEPYANFSGRLRSVQLSPDSKILVTDTEEAPSKRPPSSATGSSTAGPSTTGSSTTGSGEPADTEEMLPVVVRILDFENRTVIGQTRTRAVPRVPTIGTGFLEELHESGDRWLVQFKEFDGHDRKLAEIISSCSPTLQFLSGSVALIGTCDRSLKDHILIAVTLDGKKLWDHRTDGRRIWPAYAYSEDGSRFALATLVLSRYISADDPFDPGDIVGQVVEVFDTSEGEPRLVAPASPVLDSGQNFALSADGRRFAILHGDAIEIYDLK